MTQIGGNRGVAAINPLADNMQIPNLHDSTLCKIVFLWEEKRATFVIKHVYKDTNSYALEFAGVSKLTIPREDPWGPSSWIYNFDYKQDQDGVRSHFQMQSGDVIEVNADRVDCRIIEVADGDVEN